MGCFKTRMARLISKILPLAGKPIFFYLLFAIGPVIVWAQPEKSKTSGYVKVQAKKQNIPDHLLITVTLEIDDKIFLIGNKVPKELVHSQFRVGFNISGKPADAKIAYPPGKLGKNLELGDYTIYEGKIAITGTVRRVANDISPIEVEVRMRGLPQNRSK